jgi:hypothetical protein
VGKVIAWAKRWRTTLSIPVVILGSLALITSPGWFFFPVIFAALAVIMLGAVRSAIEMDRNR